MNLVWWYTVHELWCDYALPYLPGMQGVFQEVFFIVMIDVLSLVLLLLFVLDILSNVGIENKIAQDKKFPKIFTFNGN